MKLKFKNYVKFNIIFIAIFIIVIMTINCSSIPCSVVVIESSIKGMPCNKKEKITNPPIKLADKMDINLKKLVITGWWWLTKYTNG